jgi:hypothetical protein
MRQGRQNTVMIWTGKLIESMQSSLAMGREIEQDECNHGRTVWCEVQTLHWPPPGRLKSPVMSFSPLPHLDGLLQRLLCGCHQPLSSGAALTHKEGARRVSMVAIEVHRDINVDNVTVKKSPACQQHDISGPICQPMSATPAATSPRPCCSRQPVVRPGAP